MNVYKVTLSCERHHGNGYVERRNESQTIIAKDGDAAVKKAKKTVDWTKPILEGLNIVVTGAN